MIEVLKEVPSNVAGFKATGEVTKEDFERVVFPVVNELVERTGELNYLMLIETEMGNWTAGAWLKDALLGLKKITKWHRAAILTDSTAINKFTSIISILVPGEFKGFMTDQLPDAIKWVSSKDVV